MCCHLLNTKTLWQLHYRVSCSDNYAIHPTKEKCNGKVNVQYLTRNWQRTADEQKKCYCSGRASPVHLQFTCTMQGARYKVQGVALTRRNHSWTPCSGRRNTGLPTCARRPAALPTMIDNADRWLHVKQYWPISWASKNTDIKIQWC